MVDFTKKILNSDKFRTPALTYLRTGVYCSYPVNSADYFKFWDEESSRCLDGYTAPDGDYITGYNYFYLNYCPIDRISYKTVVNRFGIAELKRVQEVEFPDFYDYDYYFFQAVQEAEDKGKHLVVLKSRRKGYEQPYSEPVLTPTGFVPMGSLKVGDMVMNPNGNPVRIGDIVEQGITEIYEVTFQDGRTVRCGENHLWATVRNGKKFYIMRTKDYMKRKLKQGSLGKEHYPYKLPELNPLKFNSTEVPIDPYVLGVLLGDGNTCGDQVRFSTADKFILDELTVRLKDYSIKSSSKYLYCITSKNGINPLNRELKKLSLKVKANKKFIPSVYKYASIEDRMELVRGLMDTDGSISNGACSFVSTSEQLVDDLSDVLRGLGIRCRKSKEIPGRNGVDFNNGSISNTLPHWELIITTQEDIFKLPRKLDKIRKDRNYNYNGIGIASIRATGEFERQRCLCIDNENHLYITKDYIPTHNSYKCGAMMCRNFYLVESSKSYAYATEKEFLIKDGILTKAWNYLDFIDNNTAWSKKRQAVNTTMHKRASMLVTDEYGNKTEVGYKSEILGVSIKNDPDKVRGKKAKLILFEEAGKSPELGAAWQIARPSVEQDGIALGLMIAFGTGGTEGAAFETLRTMFYSPEGYNALGFPNIWDEASDGTECGFFIPQYTNLDVRDDKGNCLYMDKDGNTKVREALAYIMSLREPVIKNATDSRSVDRYVAENCLTPAEACLELTGNIFPKKELQQQLSLIRTNKKLQNHKQIGELEWVDGIPKWTPKKKGDITKYPLSKDDDPTGAIVIWEHPVKDAPHGLYIAGCLTPGEKVMTDKGLVDVEKVDHTHKLINEEGIPVSIKVFQRRYKDNADIFKIKPAYSFRTTSFTGEHPILLKDHGFVKAKDLNVGDWLEIPNLYFKQTEEYKSKLSEYLTEDVADNPLFWWFLGAWLGDGFSNKNKNSHDIYVAFGKNQIDQSEQYSRVIENIFNRSALLCKANGHSTRRFTHKKLFELLESEFGKYSYDKVIPKWVKEAPRYFKRMFLLGYLDSDGSAFYDRSLLRVTYTSNNLELLESTQDLLYGIGIASSITIHQKEHISKFNDINYISKQSYKLNILSNDLFDFKTTIPDGIISEKMNRINEYPQRYNNKKQKIIFSNDYKKIYLQIDDIKVSTYTGTVYNFECDTHTYMCRNIVTHNCDPLTTNLAVRLIIVVRIEQNRWRSLVDNTEVNN